MNTNMTTSPDGESLDTAMPIQAAGEDEANYPVPTQEEMDAVKGWLRKIAVVRQHDEPVFKQYAIDRKYASGDSSFPVKTPIIGTFIDILVSFIYARNPDIDAYPAEAVGEQRLEDARMLGKTLAIVIKQLWRKNNLKRKARRWVRSAMTIGIGWLKLTWQEEFEKSPISQQRVRDLTDNLRAIQAKQDQISRGDYEDLAACQRELEELIKGAIPTTERLVYSGLGIAFIRGENMTVSLDAENVIDCDTGSWTAERWFMPVEEAQALFQHIPPSKLKAAAVWAVKREKDREERSESGELSDPNANDASYYRSGVGDPSADGARFICGHEVWDARRNLVLDVIEGVDRYARAPEPPNVSTTRFCPFFPLAFCEVDNERHPQSLTGRGATLQDEYQRTRSAWATHRRRVRPKLVFDATALTVQTVKKMQTGSTAEMIPVKLVGGKNANHDLSKMVVPIQYPQVDAALYDTAPIRADLEIVFGIQEALSSSITVAKTATEAEIQQAGTQARSGDKRDAVETQLTDMAQFTAEAAAQKLTDEQVRVLAGPEAYWIPAANIDELEQLVVVEIRAGSSGKPNTAARQQAWSAILPQLLAGVDKVAALRRSNPLDHADSIQEIIQETMERTGEPGDASRFLPPPDPAWAAFIEQMQQAEAARAAAAGGKPGAGAAPPGSDAAAVVAPGPGPSDNPADVVAPTALPAAM